MEDTSVNSPNLDRVVTGPAPREAIGVAVAGFGWMGRVHTQAYARVLHHFPQLTIAPQIGT